MLAGMSTSTSTFDHLGTAAAEHFDLIIIGSGSGNSLISEAWEGRRVAVVDGGTFGGTCLNVGCIPTKMYAYPATLARHTADADRLGVRAAVQDVRWQGGLAARVQDGAVVQVLPSVAGG